MSLVPESLNELRFEKSDNPFKSLDIGQAAKINRITSEDLELLNLYTDGYGKGKENPGVIEEIWEGEPENIEKHKKRAREVYRLLEPYKYHFGDVFYPGMKAEMNEYMHNYLRGSQYDYAYNYYPGNDEWQVFFSSIELPAAQLLNKNTRKK